MSAGGIIIFIIPVIKMPIKTIGRIFLASMAVLPSHAEISSLEYQSYSIFRIIRAVMKMKTSFSGSGTDTVGMTVKKANARRSRPSCFQSLPSLISSILISLSSRFCRFRSSFLNIKLMARPMATDNTSDAQVSAAAIFRPRSCQV